MGSFPLQMLIIFAASSTHYNYFVPKEHCKVSRMKLSPIMQQESTDNENHAVDDCNLSSPKIFHLNIIY